MHYADVEYYEPSDSDEEQRNTKAVWPAPPPVLTKKEKRKRKKQREAREAEDAPKSSLYDGRGILVDVAEKPKEERKEDRGEEMATVEEEEEAPSIEEHHQQDGGDYKEEKEAVGAKNTAMGVEDSDPKEEASFGADDLSVDSLATPSKLLDTATPPGEEEVPSDEDGKVGAARNQRGFIWPQSVEEAPQLEDDAMAQVTRKYRSRYFFSFCS